jgi:hypothetical protein
MQLAGHHGARRGLAGADIWTGQEGIHDSNVQPTCIPAQKGNAGAKQAKQAKHHHVISWDTMIVDSVPPRRARFTLRHVVPSEFVSARTPYIMCLWYMAHD